jgi:hypothetical protein
VLLNCSSISVMRCTALSCSAITITSTFSSRLSRTSSATEPRTGTFAWTKENAAEAQTVIVNTCDVKCVWFCPQPLDEFVAEVADRDDSDAATKAAGLRPPPDQCTKTKAEACQHRSALAPASTKDRAKAPDATHLRLSPQARPR